MAKRWLDHGFITAVRPYGESSAIVSVLTKNNGRHKGFIRISKHNRAIVQLGNHVSARWNSRIDDQLGSWSFESIQQYTAVILALSGPLHALNTACRWVELILPEREVNLAIFKSFSKLIQTLNSPTWLEEFIHFEIVLLKTLGFGLDFSHCAATGTTDNLVYVSPRTGRAVSAEAGKPYKDKLLSLPHFLTNPQQRASEQDIKEALDLTKYFLERYVLAHYQSRLPYCRSKLYEQYGNHSKTLT